MPHSRTRSGTVGQGIRMHRAGVHENPPARELGYFRVLEIPIVGALMSVIMSSLFRFKRGGKDLIDAPYGPEGEDRPTHNQENPTHKGHMYFPPSCAARFFQALRTAKKSIAIKATRSMRAAHLQGTSWGATPCIVKTEGPCCMDQAKNNTRR